MAIPQLVDAAASRPAAGQGVIQTDAYTQACKHGRSCAEHGWKQRDARYRSIDPAAADVSHVGQDHGGGVEASGSCQSMRICRANVHTHTHVRADAGVGVARCVVHSLRGAERLDGWDGQCCTLVGRQLAAYSPLRLLYVRLRQPGHDT